MISTAEPIAVHSIPQRSEQRRIRFPHILPIFVELQLVFPADKKRNAQILFQFFYIPAQGWLRKMKLFRRPRERPVRGKLPQFIQLYYICVLSVSAKFILLFAFGIVLFSNFRLFYAQKREIVGQ